MQLRSALLLPALLVAAFSVIGVAGNDNVARASGAAVVVDPGGAHTCALSGAGVMSCWGWNFHGQLGDSTIESNLAPGVVPLAGVTAIASGGNHTCALTASGNTQCWGLNDHGQLGDGTSETRTAPVGVPGNGYTAIATGSSHTCAISGASAKVVCWGANNSGQLGNPALEDRTVPTDVCIDLACRPLISAVSLSAGSAHTCSINSVDGILCWGDNQAGQLGDGGACGLTCARPASVCLPDLGGECATPPDVIAVSAGGSHTCAVTSEQLAYCWGDNSQGQLGNGTELSSDVPVLVSGIDSTVAIVAGFSHTCALSSSGGVSCWGLNSVNQLGNTSVRNSALPVTVAGLAPDIVAIAAGSSHTCIRTAAGALQCWGWNADGRLGDGTFSTQDDPVDVIGFGATKAVTPTQPAPSPTPAPALIGDANCDGSVSAIDAALILQAVADLIPALPCPALGDVDTSGRTDSVDATLVLQFVAGLVTTLPP